MRKLLSLLLTFLTVSVSAIAQEITIQGKVVFSGDNEPLIGATIIPVGGGTGVSTDIDGNFSLKVPDTVKKINVSYVGMTTQQVDVTSGQPMTIALSLSLIHI